ncbi:hypothetical protein ACFQ08_44110, partial [Streptosporangium algeriense]
AGLAFVNDGRATTVLRLTGRPSAPEALCVVPEALRGGVWLDERGERLAVRFDDSRDGAVLDLRTGGLEALPDALTGVHLLGHAPGTGVSLIAARVDGTYRIGFHRDDDERPAFPDRLNGIEGVVTPLALDPTGRRVALAVHRGARSHLLLHDLAADTPTQVELPPGILIPVASWGEGGLHVVLSAPDRPPHPLRVEEGG